MSTSNRHLASIRYSQVPKAYWKRRANQRAFMEELEHELDLRTPEDWYDLTASAIHRYGGSELLRRYSTCVCSLVMDYLPDQDWKEWLFPKVPRGFWEEQANGRRYLDWLAQQLGFTKREDWYRLTILDLRRNRGGALASRFKGKLSAIVMAHFPEHEWLEWLFAVTPRGFWDDSANCRRYLDWLGEQLGFDHPQDFYEVQSRDFSDHKGAALLRRSGYRLISVLRAYFPEHEWLEWKMGTAPFRFWQDPANVKRYLGWLSRELGFAGPEDWYQLTCADLIANDGSALLSTFGGPAEIAMSYFPEHDWQEWKFSSAPRNFWSQPANHHRYLDWLGEALGFVEPEDWYDLTCEAVRENHGDALLKRFNNSPSRLVKYHFPKREFLEWFFHATPSGFWQERSNGSRYLEWLGRELGFEKQEDWYRLTTDNIALNRGRGLLSRFNGSVVELVKFHFPEHEWMEWRFTMTPKNFWDDRKNRRRYLEWLARQLGYEKKEDWYQVTVVDVYRHHGAALLERYRQSPIECLKDSLPENEWTEWAFPRVPRGFWNHRENRRRYLEWLGKKLNLKDTEDWLQLGSLDFKRNRGSGLLALCQGSPRVVLLESFPKSHPVYKAARRHRGSIQPLARTSVRRSRSTAST